MWFPIEIFAQIKDYMLDYKNTFSLNVLPLIFLQKAVGITHIGPKFKGGDFSSNRYIYEILYSIPRYSHQNISETRLNKLGLTQYGPTYSNKDEKRYMYLRNDGDWLNLEGYRDSRYFKIDR